MSISGGPFHEAALAGSVEEFEKLANSGVDPNTANSAGRLPLHTFCSQGWVDDEFPFDSPVPRAATEWLLRHTDDINAPDQDGITALHIASMMSQYLVKELLTAGADPTCTTCDGMNALHLAARARQSNIVGMLIDANSVGRFQKDLVNDKDEVARTPLHYACRSGRPETVAYLMAAGADSTSLDVDGLTLLDACLEFEEEQALWADYRELEIPDWYFFERLNYLPDDWAAHAFGGFRRQDDNRPWIRPGRNMQHARDRFDGGPWPEDTFRIVSVQHTTRLGEILDTLIQALVDRGEGAQAVQEHIAKCIKRCETSGLEYTKSALAGSIAAPSDHTVNECIQSNQFQLEKHFGKKWYQPSDHVHLALFDNFLRKRQYDVLERILRCDGSFLPLWERDVYDIARLLVNNGFAKLLSVLLNSKYGAQLRSGANVTSPPSDPLLILAVKRQLPNMDVVRLLVEKAQVDINARSRTREETTVDPDLRGLDFYKPGLDTALHLCAKGFNWWQVKYCLPYLLHHGADPSLKNEAGATPYEITQEDYKETFMDDAAKLLKFTS